MIIRNYDQLSADELRRLLLDQVCPLWSKDYKTQLDEKRASHVELLSGLVNEIQELHSSKSTTEAADEVAGFYEGIRYVEDEPSHYRNKCELTVGMDGTVGFRLGENSQPKIWTTLFALS